MNGSAGLAGNVRGRIGVRVPVAAGRDPAVRPVRPGVGREEQRRGERDELDRGGERRSRRASDGARRRIASEREQVRRERGDEQHEEERRGPGDVAAVSRNERRVGPPGERAGRGDEREDDRARRDRERAPHGFVVVSAGVAVSVVAVGRPVVAWRSSSCRSCRGGRVGRRRRDVVRVVAERERAALERLVLRIGLRLGELPRAAAGRSCAPSSAARSRPGSCRRRRRSRGRSPSGSRPPGSPSRRRSRDRACSRRTTRRRACRSCPSCRRRAGRTPARDARAVADVVLEDLGHLPCDAVRDHARSLRRAPAGLGVLLAVRQHDLADRRRLGVDAACGERRVGGCHVERRDRDRAEAHRRHVVAADLERRAHAELARHRADPVRPDVERQLGVDGVVRAERRPRDRRPAVVGRVVGLHAPPRAVVAVAVLRPAGR